MNMMKIVYVFFRFAADEKRLSVLFSYLRDKKASSAQW